uniref:Uncharacterized protein n=1 Tax=Anguilla anguilla TaxID=7936 RepID=A0A0E9R6G3_ANGAN
MCIFVEIYFKHGIYISFRMVNHYIIAHEINLATLPVLCPLLLLTTQHPLPPFSIK